MKPDPLAYEKVIAAVKQYLSKHSEKPCSTTELANVLLATALLREYPERKRIIYDILKGPARKHDLAAYNRPGPGRTDTVVAKMRGITVYPPLWADYGAPAPVKHCPTCTCGEGHEKVSV